MTDAGKPRPAWVDEGARDGDHAQVSLPLYLISDPLGLLVTTRSSIRIYTRRLCSTFMPQLGQNRGEIVAAAASATVPNVVGLIGTKAGLNVQIAAMRM